MAAIRCPECGSRYIKEPARRCKPCAEAMARSFTLDDPNTGGIRDKSFSDNVLRKTRLRRYAAIAWWLALIGVVVVCTIILSCWR